MVLRKIVCIFLFLLFANYGYSQNKDIDSLKNLLKIQIDDTIKLSLHLSLGKEYKQISLDSFKIHINQARKLSSSNDNYKLDQIYNSVGLSHFYESNIDSAHYYFDKALPLIDDEDWKTKAAVYGNYSMSFLTSSDFDKKVSYNLKAIEFAKNDPNEVSRYYYNQAVIYGGQTGMAEQSKKYLKLAYESSKKGKNDLVEAVALKGLAYYALEENDLDNAKLYLLESEKLCKKTKSPQICYEAYIELGRLYESSEKYIEAQKTLLEANRYAKMRNRKYDVMVSNGYLGINAANRNDYVNAIKYFNFFETIYKEEPVPELGVELFRKWSEVEAKNKNHQKSLALLLKSTSIKDSIYSDNNRKILADAEAKYKTEKKDKELAEQKLALEQQELELQKKKTQYSYMTGAVLLLLVGATLLWFLFQQRQKRKNQEIISLKREQQVKTLESLIEGEEKERFRIAKELHDGVNVDLSAIKYKLTSLLEKNNEVINEAVAMIDKSCEQVRAISHNLVPPALKDFSLLEAIEDFCSTTNTIHKPQVTFQHIGESISISKKAEVNIFRIVQELITNSIKHAEASEIDVQVSHHNKTIQLTVEDNGKGFKKEDNETNGIGLENVKSRVEYLNGKLDFNSDHKGTSYIIDINTDQLS